MLSTKMKIRSLSAEVIGKKIVMCRKFPGYCLSELTAYRVRSVEPFHKNV